MSAFAYIAVNVPLIEQVAHARALGGEVFFVLGIGRHDAPSDMLSLIQNYPEYVRSIERSASRGLPREPIVGDEENAALTDFPRETKKRTDALAREERYEEALAVKDRMLWEVNYIVANYIVRNHN